ncbi:Clr5 domain-containing protein [Xylariales sp. AK1849]|nr:Clr5 domain-containing protein [Xylariales sp. AK1849]
MANTSSVAARAAAPNNSNNASGPPGGGTWATPHDWATHRETIAALYEGQNMTLKKIMHIMERDHNFFATERMYKSRLKQWGLRKNYRYDEVSEIIRQQGHHRSAAGKPSGADGRVRKGETRRRGPGFYYRRPPSAIIVKGRASSGPAAIQQMTPSPTALSCRTASPAGPAVSFLFPLTPPEDMKAPEECMLHISHYFAGAFDMGLWKLSDPDWLVSNRRLIDWFNRIALARGTLAGGHTKQGFQLIQTSFDEYKDMLLLQDPRLILYSCTALFLLMEFPEVVDVLLKYMSDLSRIVQGPLHPLQQLIAQLHQMGKSKMVENGRHIFECQIAMFQKYLEPDNAVLRSVTVFAARNLAVARLIDTNAAESSLRALPMNLDHNGQVRMALAQVYGVGGRYLEARRIANELLDSAVHPRTKAGAFDTLFYICREEGDDELIRDTSHRRIKFCLETFGPRNEWTVDAGTDFETHLRETGDIGTADRVFKDYGIQMDELADGVAELQLNG